MKKVLILSICIILAFVSCNNNKHKSIKQLESGIAFYNKNKLDSSLICLTEAIKLDTTNSEAYYFLSKVNYKIINYSDGLKYLNIAEKRKYNTDSIQELKLKLLFAMENYDEYIDYCNKMISKNTSNYKMYFNKSKALFNKSIDANSEDTKLQLQKEALENISISLNLNKNDNETYGLRGAIRYTLTDYKGAINDFDIVIKSEKKDSLIISISYRYKGLTEKELNNFTYAEALIDSAISYNPKESILFIARGEIRVILNKGDFACDDFRKALELGEKNAIDEIREHCK